MLTHTKPASTNKTITNKSEKFSIYVAAMYKNLEGML